MRKLTNFGANRLKTEFKLPHSSRTIHKIFKHKGLVNKQQKKHHIKLNLQIEKAKKYKPLQFSQVDIKYLTDIQKYYRYMVQLRLPLPPKYKCTIREVHKGALFTGFAADYNMFFHIFLSICF
ncbi:MAG TPA: hypothetical protein PK189_11675 [bacterium]|nr:hypothetical protein [bacterium]